MKTIYRIQINYKSGKSMVFDVYEFNIKNSMNGNKTITWDSAGDICPLLMGVSDIESVWRIGTNEVNPLPPIA